MRWRPRWEKGRSDLESYREILDRMRETYTEKSGNRPEDVSDINLRMQVVAGEVYRLQARMDWQLRQAFPQTADGAQLDRHGAQRGLKRGGSKKAGGVLTFSRYVPISFDLVIPKGTVCASYGGEAVEYETTEEAVLAAGEVTVSVPARAVTGGSAGNAAAGYINTIVTEVNGINYVTNPLAFSGGTDPEPDGDYRGRIMAGIGRLEGFGTAGYYEGIALEQDGVYSAQAGPSADGSGVTVYVWGNGAAVPADAVSALQEELNGRCPLGVTVTVQPAATKKVGVGATLRMREGADYKAATAALSGPIKAWLNRRTVGESVYMADVQRLILETEPGVGRVTFIDACKDHEGALGVVPIAGLVTFMEDK